MPKMPKFVQITGGGNGGALFALDETGSVWAYGTGGVGDVQGWAELSNHRFVDDRSH